MGQTLDDRYNDYYRKLPEWQLYQKQSRENSAEYRDRIIAMNDPNWRLYDTQNRQVDKIEHLSSNLMTMEKNNDALRRQLNFERELRIKKEQQLHMLKPTHNLKKE